MATEVILPRVDMDMTTGTISRWFVGQGERVEKGAVLFEIETDKAAMEIDAPASGLVHRLAADDGSAIPVGARVAWILAEGEGAPGDGAAAPAPSAPAAAAATVAQEPPLDAKADAGLPDAASAPVPVRAPSPAGAPAACAAPSADSCTDARPRATPLARRLAREKQIDLQSLTGSGPNGRIQSRDVEAAAEQAVPREAAVLEAASAPAAIPARAEAPARPPATPPAPPRTPRPPSSSSSAEGTLNRVWLRRGTGTPLVVIHGFGSELGMWRPLVAALPGERPVLAVDLPGHGLSPAHATSFSGLVDAIAGVLAEEEVQEAHLAGHSLGAAVAVALADGGAVGARSLFLISPAGLGPDIDGAFLSGFTRARDVASLGPWMRLLVHDAASLPSSLVAATARSRADRNLVDAQAALAEDLFPDATQIFSVREALERVSVPARIVFGLADRIIPSRHALGLPGTIALHLFPQVGHMPQIEARDAIVRLLGDHLA